MGMELYERLGVTVSGEKVVIVLPRPWHPDPAKPCCLVPHGHGGDATGVWMEGFGAHVAKQILRFGIPLIGMDAAGGAAWGDDTAIADVDAAFAYMVNTYGVRADKALGWGFSMGSLTILNYLFAHPTKLLGVMAGGIPDVRWQHDNVPAYATEIEAVYGGAAWTNAMPTHNPNDYAASLPADVPIRAWYSNDDTTVPPAQQTQFAASAPNIVQTNMGNVGGHTPEPIPDADVAAFVKGLL